MVLGVQEVWFWLKDKLEIYVLGAEDYQKKSNSYNLTNLDSKLLAKYISQVLTGNPRLLKKSFLSEIDRAEKAI